jgi:hypothetical protein
MSLQPREGLRRPKGRNERAIFGNGSYPDLAQDSLNSLTNRGPELLNPPPNPGRFGLPPQRPRTCRGNARKFLYNGIARLRLLMGLRDRLVSALPFDDSARALPDLLRLHARE